jgi:hypothetical protein
MLEPAKRRFAESSMKVVFRLRSLLLLGERIVEVERTQGVARFTAHDMIFEVDWEENHLEVTGIISMDDGRLEGDVLHFRGSLPLPKPMFEFSTLKGGTGPAKFPASPYRDKLVDPPFSEELIILSENDKILPYYDKRIDTGLIPPEHISTTPPVPRQDLRGSREIPNSRLGNKGDVWDGEKARNPDPDAFLIASDSPPVNTWQWEIPLTHLQRGVEGGGSELHTTEIKPEDDCG